MITMTARRLRGRGKGSVYEDRARGRWVAAVSLESEPGTRRRPRRKQSAATQAEALLRKMMAELDETGTVSAKNYTVGRAIADYVSHPPSTWKTASTVSVNATHAAHLTAALGPVLLTRLTVQQVEDHLAAEGRRGLSRSAVDGQRFLLRLVIKRAQKTDLVNRNVADLADLPAGLPVRKSRSMSVAQMDALLNLDYTRWDASSGGTGHLAGAYWRAWLACALLLGLRPGEIGALRWDDLTGGVLQVRHGLQRTGDGNGLAVANLKTAGSRRAMEIPDDAAGPLAAWKKVQAAQRMAAGGPPSDPSRVPGRLRGRRDRALAAERVPPHLCLRDGRAGRGYRGNLRRGRARQLDGDQEGLQAPAQPGDLRGGAADERPEAGGVVNCSPELLPASSRRALT